MDEELIRGTDGMLGKERSMEERRERGSEEEKDGRSWRRMERREGLE